MKAIHVDMVIRAGKDDMPPIIAELWDKYKPKQLSFHECEYFEK